MDISLGLLCSLHEKEKFFNYLNDLAEGTKTHIEAAGNSDYKKIIEKFLLSIKTYVIDMSQRIVSLQAIVGEFQDKIPFNLTQAKFSKLVYFLIKSNYFTEASADKICNFFSKYSTVIKNNKAVSPTSLSATYRRLNSDVKSKESLQWFDEQKLSL